MLINCDIGERGSRHKIDDELIKHIDIANIACSGHAGDDQSIAWYVRLANEYKVAISAHLSYPDKENFGRVSMQLGIDKLLNSLDIQLDMLNRHGAKINLVKFHGALYNDSVKDKSMADLLTCWLVDNNIRAVITDYEGELAKNCIKANITVIAEYFADRTYIIENGNARLTPRNLPFACIRDSDLALKQATLIRKFNQVNAYVKKDNWFSNEVYSFPPINNAQTSICIHSDSEIALELSKRVTAEFQSIAFAENFKKVTGFS